MRARKLLQLPAPTGHYRLHERIEAMEPPYRVLQSKNKYRGQVFDVDQVKVVLPDGHTKHLDIVTHNGAVTIIPIDTEGLIWFIRQYRHPAKGYILELPAGTMENDEPPEMCALRETREEIGMAPGKLEELGTFFLAPGYSTEFMYVYLATDLRLDPLEGDSDEFLSIVKMPIAEAYQRSLRGEVRDAKSLAALHLARPHLLPDG